MRLAAIRVTLWAAALCCALSGAGCAGPRVSCLAPEDWYYRYPAFPGYDRGCVTDEDCTVATDLCDCSSGGFKFAVARNSLPALREHQKRIYPEGKGCPTVISAHPSCMQPVRATCMRHTCVLAPDR